MYKKTIAIFSILLLFIFNIFNTEIINIEQGEKITISTAKPINTKIMDNNNDIEITKRNDSLFKNEIEVFANTSGKSKVQFDVLGVPIKEVEVNSNEKQFVYPGGNAIAIKMNTDGVLVLNIGYVNDEDGNIVKPSNDKLKVGDIIYKVNGNEITTKEDLKKEIEESEGDVTLSIKSNEEFTDITVTPAVSIEDGKRKLGVWVRDSTQGIGTTTYITEDKNKFASLGHGIMDIDTRELMTVRDGTATITEINSIQKGKKGVPGELIGEIESDVIFGSIEENKKNGVFGYVSEDCKDNITGDLIEIGDKEDIKIGPATILSNVNSNEVKEYDIFIDNINYKEKSGKNMTITITDKELLDETGGIVQGMSGSPIIQDNKLIGAVTHVFVQDPKKGYGIFIEDMM